MRVVGLCGSLRKASANAGLLRACQAALKSKHNIHLDVVSIAALPLFNQDAETPLPASVAAFRDSIGPADGFVFAACEYNSSISAALKNAIDWGSRGNNLFNNKPACIVGAGGYAGTTRAQNHLRDILAAINSHAMTHPELRVEIFKTPRPFDAATGDLVCEATQVKVQHSADAFAQYAKAISGANLDAVRYRS